MKIRPHWQSNAMIGALALLGAAGSAHALAPPPTTTLVSNAVVTPSAAWTAYGSGLTHTNGLAAWTGLPPEMAALARALGSDRVPNQVDAATYTKNVFEYVRNNIDTEFRFGLSKGGRGALIDQSGTAFDQAELMVKLLRAANISASYQIGTITLSAQQFGQWTGLFATLDQPTQSVTVNAAAACKLLADGAIPSTCSVAASGNLSTITLAHIWVSANGNLYDPSFKPYALSNGIDVPAAMSCGTNAASTCGTAMTTAAMTGASSGNTTVGGQAVPYVQFLNDTQLYTRLTTAATALQNQIHSTNRLARLEEIVGGRVLATTATPTIGSTLSYVASTQATWTGDVPDQYRTTLRVRVGDFPIYFDTMVLKGYVSTDRTFFVDELAGRSLQLHAFEEQAMLLDATPLPANGCTGCNGYVQLDVNHPYATAAYGDEAISLGMFADSGDGVHTPTGGSFPVTIIQGWGNSAQSSERHFAALQETLPTATHGWSTLWDGSGSLPTVIRTDFNTHNQALLGSRLLVQSAVADRLISGLAKSAITRHHSLGIAFAHAYSPATLTNISVQTAVSVVSAADDSVARSAAFETSASTFATIEGSVNQQLESSPVGVSTSSYFRDVNLNLPGKPRGKFLQMTSAQILAAYSSNNTAYYSSLKNAASAGYGAIVPDTGGTEILTRTNGIAHTVGAQLKGGAGMSADPVSRALESVRLADIASARKKYLSVSPADGTATLAETDLVTGAGGFPYALPLQRTYSTASSVTDFSDSTVTNSWNPNNEQQSVSNNISLQYSGPDSAANSRIGMGWNHNYNVIATYTGNGPKALGADYAIEASASIAALRSIYDAARAPSLSGRISSMLASDWLARYQWAFNSVAIDKGGATETFQRLPVGFFTPTGSAYLEQSGAPVNNDVASVSFRYTGKGGDTIDFAVGRAIVATASAGASMARSLPYFYATAWNFPDGVTVTFHYDSEYIVESYDPTIYQNCTGGPGCPTGRLTVPSGLVLSSVSNNLGRSLTFNTTSTTVPVLMGSDAGPGIPQTLTSRFTITGVTDENGQSVTYTPTACTIQSPCNKLTVKGPDGGDNIYDYMPGADSPNPARMGRDSFKLRRWFTPSDTTNAYRVVVYDEMLRARSVRDALGNSTFYYPSGVMGAERWKRSEAVSPLGSVTTSFFDDHNNLIKTVDPNGMVTATTYDRANRKLVTTLPEGNTVEQGYDIRSNVVSTVRRSKPLSGLVELTTSATYGEGETVVNCTNWKTCNQPATETDAKTNVTNYSYSSSTGQLLTVRGAAVPLNGTNTQPLTTLCYTPYNGISMLSGRIDKVNASTNRVRAFSYNGSNKYVLQTATVDPTTTLAPPSSPSLTCPTSTKSGAFNIVTTLTFDGVGNLSSVDGPRTDVTDVTSYTFDQARRITKIAAPLGATTRYCYDADGLLRGTHRARAAAVADPNAATATTNGSCASAYPAGNWQSEVRDYWASGDLRSVQDAEGNITRYAYDNDGRQRVVQDPDGRQTATVYDLASQVVATWRGGRTWIDSNGRPVGAPGTGTSWNPATYASNGNNGPFRYAAFAYTNNGKQKSIQDAGNNQTDYAYDGHDRLAFALFPDPATGSRCSVAAPVTDASAPTCTGAQTFEKSTYDNNSNRLTLLTRKGDTLTWTYDAGNRVSTKAVGGTPTLGLVTQTYNLVNEPLSVSSPVSGSIPAHSVTYDYDAAGRKLYEENLINGTNRRVSYDYGDKVNRTKTIWPDTYFVYYSYDALNRMEYARENSTTTNELARYQYDTLSRRGELRFAGVATNRIGYTFEPDSQLDVLTNVLNATTVTLDYGHNASGQVNSIVASDNFYLPGPVTGSPIAMPTAYTPDKLNRYGALTIGGAATTPTYDLNGNLLTWGPTASKQTYTYDAENRLRTANVTGGSGSTYDYDALGRRISKMVGSTPTYYLLDGDEEIGEYDGAGVVQFRYLMGPSVDDRIARAQGSATSNPTKTYYHVNHQGSVIATANANGSIATQLAYDEYGNLTSQAPATPTGEVFRYTGRRFDAETGLYYYRARYYASTIGRFLQTDPIGYKDDNNLYTYVGDDPVNRSDPSGLKCETVGERESCTVDHFQDKKGNPITREQATAKKGDAKRIEQLESRMTTKYHSAKELAARGGSVTIKGNKKKDIADQTVSGSEIVDKMQTVEITAAAGEKPGSPNTNADTLVQLHADGSMTSSTIFWSNGRSGAARTFGHEILHSIYPEKVGLRGGWNKLLPSDPNLHDRSFDDASDDIR